MARFSIALLALFVIVLALVRPYQACRLLDEEEILAKNARNFVNFNDNLHLQALQKGSVRPPGPNGCSYVRGSKNPCKTNGQKFAGKRTTALPPSLRRHAYPQALAESGVAS
ncbi:hypothetical protein ACET3Z_012771 [Daucus carota]